MNKLLLGLLVLSIIGVYFMPDCFLAREDMPRFFLAVATLSATLFGFVFTGISLLLSLNKEILINNMKKVGLYKYLVWYLYLCAFMFLLTMVFSITSFFVKNIMWWKINLMIFAVGVYLLTFIGSIFVKILAVVSAPTGNPNVLDVEKIE